MQKKTITITVLLIATLLCIGIGLTWKYQSQGNLYIDKFETTLAWASTEEGRGEKAVSEVNITLVNPTGNAFNDLNITIKLDESDLSWYSNYTVSYENATPFVNYSIPQTINIEPQQNKTINIFFACLDSFGFSPHNIQVYVSQNQFGDVINGQSFDIPQSMAYLKILSYSQVETSLDSFHKYGNVYRLVNPNFLQQYANTKQEIGSANYFFAADKGYIGLTYFNVTIANNSTFPVTHVALFGDTSLYPNGFVGRAHYNLTVQPNETLLFPVGQKTIPSNGYITGSITNTSSAQ